MGEHFFKEKRTYSFILVRKGVGKIQRKDNCIEFLFSYLDSQIDPKVDKVYFFELILGFTSWDV